MNYRGLQSGFTTGELSPKMLGQVDFQQYQYGCELLENYIVWPQGMISRRPGTRFVARAGIDLSAVRLLPFEFSTQQAYVIEAGDFYFRFYMDQGQIMKSGVPYQLATNFSAEELAALGKCQSADVMFLTHGAHYPQMLSREGHTKWSLAPVPFIDGPYLDMNITTATLTPDDTTGDITIVATTVQGPELVRNGSFDWTYGAEQVINGDFATSYRWNFDGHWFLDEGFNRARILLDDGVLTQSQTTTAGYIYRIRYTVQNYSAGSCYAKLGGTGASRTADGNYEELITATDLNQDLEFYAVGFTGAITNVSMARVLYDSNWVWGTGWTQNTALGVAEHAAGHTNPLEQILTIDAGKKYDLVFTVTRTAGSVTPYLGNVAGSAVNTSSVSSQSITTNNTDNLKFVPSSDFVGSIDLVSCKLSADSAETFKIGHVGSVWSITHGETTGTFKISEFVSTTEVKATVLMELGGTTAVTEWREGAWSDYRGWPAICGFFENRLWFASTTHQPQTLWASKSGDYYNFKPGSDDNDPLTLTLCSDQVNTVTWISGTKVLLVGTARGQWHISATGTNESMTPSNVKASQETGLTSGSIFSRCDHTVLFWQKFGRNLIEVAYSLESDAYLATPLTVLAEHIGLSPIIEMTYIQEPLGSLWCVRTDGQLAVLTYERQHKVVAWSRLVTDGLFESIVHIPGVDRDEIWVVVKRTVDGEDVRYIELFEQLEIYEEDVEDWFFVDSGLTYDGAPISTLTGFDHLEGKDVNVLADGGVLPNATVTGGAFTMAQAIEKAQVGLPFVSTCKPVRQEAKVQGMTIQNRRQRMVTCALRFYKSWAGKIGEDLSKLEVITFKQFGNMMDTPLVPFTGDVRIQFPGSYNRDGQMYLVQDLPLALNVMAMVTKVDFQA